MSLSEKAVNESAFGTSFIKPLYKSYCFSNIPGTIFTLLGVPTNKKLPPDVIPGGYKSYQKVVFIFVDAFGWKFYKRYQNQYPSLKRFVNNGSVSKITSQFPSTTVVQVTTMNTGKTVGESGIYEWYYYEPKVDAVIAPLLFSYATDKERGTLKTAGVKPADIYPSGTVYERLLDSGITSNIFMSSEFINSQYNTVVSKGANLYSYDSINTGLENLARKLIDDSGRSYYYFYYGDIDKMGHDYGTESEEFNSKTDLFFSSLEKYFFNSISDKVNDTIILLGADHGQTNVDPKTTIYLNRLIPDIAKYFKTTKKNVPIVPSGSCRDMFLYVKEDVLDKSMKMLKEKLVAIAEVHKTSELIKMGFFGQNISQEFISRIGNLVILPYSGQSVWWYQEGVFEQNNFGHHGGLTREEMEIPFLALTL